MRAFFAVLGLWSSVWAASFGEVRQKNDLRIGIISAIPGESGALAQKMERVEVREVGGRSYVHGSLFGIDTVTVNARIGKVAAAVTATQLVAEYEVDCVIFTGVAGAIDPSLSVGDVVVGSALIQHDMDARPFCPLHEIPLLKITALRPDPDFERVAIAASQNFVRDQFKEKLPSTIIEEYKIEAPKVVSGMILTGDRVISTDEDKERLKGVLPSALCVEMEGASVAQVCHEYDVPCVVIRTISDHAKGSDVHLDILKFIAEVSGHYSMAIIENIYSSL